MKKITVLFACVENSFRSQIAEGVAKKYFNDRISAYSAGSQPSGKVHPNALNVLEEIGVDGRRHYSKGFDELQEKDFDCLVTMGCGEICPFVTAKKHLSWDLPDIKNDSIEKIRVLRDLIKKKIQNEILEE